MRAIFFTIFIFVAITLCGQVEGNDLILTQEQNANWFIQLEQIELKNQIELINKRILLDTNVFIPPNRTDRYLTDNLNGRLSGYCKPVIVAGGVPIYIENRTKISDIKRLTDLLNLKTINSIEIISGDKAKAIYGSKGGCKALIVTLRKKSTKRKLEKLEMKMHPSTVTN
jgi:hypothetical protein